jgi:hypothetical protein
MPQLADYTGTKLAAPEPYCAHKLCRYHAQKLLRGYTRIPQGMLFSCACCLCQKERIQPFERYAVIPKKHSY